MKDGLYWAEKLRDKTISFQELLEEFKSRAQQQNKTLNAFVTMLDQEALAEYHNIGTAFCGFADSLKNVRSRKEGLVKYFRL